MCDTLFIPATHTATNKPLFAKNSDREPNEAQAVVRYERTKTRASHVQCTYISIPQVAETYEVILSKPFHMWGAEMGVNEFGVAIGNEAVFTKVNIKKQNTGLTGMDLLRLGLERSSTADEALHTITTLLQQYGQDACGGYQNKDFFYHNSFIIADVKSAWVLETAGKHWVAERIRGVRTISNGLTIGDEYDLISDGAIDFAKKKGWIKSSESFSFSKAYSAWFMTKMGSCAIRQHLTTKAATRQGITVSDAMIILASHHQADFIPSRGSTQDVCMHATGIFCPSQTVGSMVAELSNSPNVWVTGTSNPCLSLFKPIHFGDYLPESFQPGARPDQSLWWKAENFHRLANLNYAEIKSFCDREIKTRQSSFLHQKSPVEVIEFHEEKIDEGVGIFSGKPKRIFAPFYQNYWHKRNNVFIR